MSALRVSASWLWIHVKRSGKCFRFPYCRCISYTKHLHLHLSRSHGDRWGVTDLATLSLHLTLFSDSLRASQTSTLSTPRCYSPNASFVGLFFSLLALFLVKLSWQALLVLIHAQTILTCVSLLWFVICSNWACYYFSVAIVLHLNLYIDSRGVLEMAPTVRERELASPWWARNNLVQIFSLCFVFSLSCYKHFLSSGEFRRSHYTSRSKAGHQTMDWSLWR